MVILRSMPGAARPSRSAADNPRMKNLRPETLGMLKRIEALSGRPVEFKPDSSLTLRATMQLARSGAASHVLRYRPTNEPLDYWVAYQAGYLLRLLELPPAERFDFAGTGTAPGQVEELLATGQPQADDGRSSLAQFAEMTAHWALLNLRSYAIGMRIDQWLADAHPELSELQAAGMDSLQQENVQLLSRRMGKMSIPVPLLGPVAAYALFADRLLGKTAYGIPYRAAGVLDLGAELLALLDKLPPDAAHDRELVDAWAAAIGMAGWYAWIPYKP
jgi:hypothetical protein